MGSVRIWMVVAALLAVTQAARGQTPGPQEDVTTADTELLEMFFTDKDPQLRAAAAAELGRRGSAAMPAVPALVSGLADPEPRVREAVLVTLRTLHVDPTRALIERVATGEPSLQIEAARAVGRIVLADASVSDALAGAALQEGAPDEVVAACVQALGDIGAVSSAALGAMSKALTTESELTRAQSVWALAKLGLPGTNVVRKHLEDATDSDFREFVASKLGSCAPRAEVVEVLRWCLRDDSDYRVRNSAAASLGELGAAAEPAIPDLIHASESGERYSHTALLAIEDVANASRSAGSDPSWFIFRRMWLWFLCPFLVVAVTSGCCATGGASWRLKLAIISLVSLGLAVLVTWSVSSRPWSDALLGGVSGLRLAGPASSIGLSLAFGLFMTGIAIAIGVGHLAQRRRARRNAGAASGT